METSSFLPTSYEFGQGREVRRVALRPRQGRDHRDRTRTAAGRRQFRRPPTGPTPPRSSPTCRHGAPTGAGSRARRRRRRASLEPRALGVAGGGRDELVSVQFKGNAADPAEMKAFRQFRHRMQDAFAAHRLRIGFDGGIAEQTDIRDATRSGRSSARTCSSARCCC